MNNGETSFPHGMGSLDSLRDFAFVNHIRDLRIAVQSSQSANISRPRTISIRKQETRLTNVKSQIEAIAHSYQGLLEGRKKQGEKN